MTTACPEDRSEGKPSYELSWKIKVMNKNKSQRTQKQINRSSHSKQVNIKPYTVNSDPPQKKQVTFDPNTKNKSNSIPYTEIKVISTPLLKSSHFVPNSEIKSISMPSYKKQFIFDPNTKTKYFSTPTQKPSQLGSLH